MSEYIVQITVRVKATREADAEGLARQLIGDGTGEVSIEQPRRGRGLLRALPAPHRRARGQVMIRIQNRKDLTSTLRTLRIGPDYPGCFLNFTSFGSYTLTFVCHDGEVAHPQCVANNLKEALSRHAGDRFVALDTYYEGPTLECLYCEHPIESSYGEPEE